MPPQSSPGSWRVVSNHFEQLKPFCIAADWPSPNKANIAPPKLVWRMVFLGFPSIDVAAMREFQKAFHLPFAHCGDYIISLCSLMLSLHNNIFLETVGDIRVNSLAPFWGQASLAWMKQKETTKKGMLTSTILPTLQVWNGLNCLNSFLCFNLRSSILTHTNVHRTQAYINIYCNNVTHICISNTNMYIYIYTVYVVYK